MNNHDHKNRCRSMLLASRLAILALIGMCGVNRAQAQQWVNNGTNINNTNTGNVGIGTTTPAEKLVTIGNILVGNINSRTMLYSTFDSQGNVVLELGYGTATSNITPLPVFTLSKNLTNPNTGLGAISFANSAIANGSDKRLAGISTFTDGALNSGAMVLHTSSLGVYTERIRITSTGNVGIGTSTPGRPLEVLAPAGDAARLYRNATTPGWGVNLSFAFNNSNGARVDYAGVHGIIQSSTAGAENGSVVFSTVSAGSPLTERMRVSASGNVGIGTPNPAKALHVAAANSQVMIDRTANTAGNYALLNFATNGAQKFMLGLNADAGAGVDKLSFFDSGFSASNPVMTITSGNVGVGTMTPASKFDVSGEIRSSSGGFRFPDGTLQVTAAVAGGGTISATNISAGQFGQNTGGGNYTFPGNVIVTGNIAAKYQDVAEWVPASHAMPAGTVVVLDITTSNQVTASTHPYDSRVAGVISVSPGLVLGEEASGRLLVATTGRVKVKVDAANGPIEIGDLLVTSDREGVAMKSVAVDVGGVRIHRPGTIIGKALEPLAKGTGEILVLLSLQ